MATWLFLLWGSTAWTASEGAVFPDCQKVTPEVASGGMSRYVVDQGWSGTLIGYEGISDGRKIYTAYYDKDRWLTVASLEPSTNMFCKIRLSSRFSGWDSHKYPKLALDAHGILHVAANMHDSPLVYAHAQQPGSIEGMKLDAMTGLNEDRVTYPVFLRAKSAGLLFFYRDGSSGNGLWYVNHFVKGKWVRLVDKPIYEDSWSGRSVSAYPSSPFLDSDGIYHIAIVWRENRDVKSNFAISYVKTPDFINFFSAKGARLTLPISPDSKSLVMNPGPSEGLGNNARVVAGENGKPIIFYTKYDEEGRNGAYVASYSGGTWIDKRLDSSNERIAIQGTGSIKMPVEFENEGSDAGQQQVSVYVKILGKPLSRYVISTIDLSNRKYLIQTEKSAKTTALTIPGGMENSAPLSGPVYLGVSGTGKKIGAIRYYAQLPNGDKPRVCTKKFPMACNPVPSPIEIDLNAVN